ncbi:hypothetical protein D3C86_1597840 [compost metagenome]
MDRALGRTLGHAGEPGYFGERQRAVDGAEGAQDFEPFFERLIEQRIGGHGRRTAGWITRVRHHRRDILHHDGCILHQDTHESIIDFITSRHDTRRPCDWRVSSVYP